MRLVAIIIGGVLACGACSGGGAHTPTVVDAGPDGAAVEAGACGAGAAGWTQRIDAGSSQPARPTASWHAEMATDLGQGEVVLFGGETADATVLLDEAWSWNGATAAWTNRTPTPRPASWPSARAEQRMVRDPVRGTVLMFGGLLEGVSPTDELWEWNGRDGTWTNLTPAPRPAAWPEPRYSHMLTYDRGRSRLVLFGGFGPTDWPGYAGDLWEWDSSAETWTDRTPTPLPAAWPEPRQSGGMVYDPSAGKTLLFGGWDNAPLDDTWEWDGAAGVWTDRTLTPRPASWPPAGSWQSLIIDGCLGRPLAVAGDGLVEGNTGLPNVPPQLWAWASAAGTWTSFSPTPLPASWPATRQVPAVAWDPIGLQVLFFGGKPFGELELDDTWTWRAP